MADKENNKSKIKKIYDVDGEKMKFNSKTFNIYFGLFQDETGRTVKDVEADIADFLSVSDSTVHSWRFGMSAPSELSIVKELSEYLKLKDYRLLLEKVQDNEIENITDRQKDSLKRIYDAVIEFLDEYQHSDDFSNCSSILKKECINSERMLDKVVLALKKEDIILNNVSVYRNVREYICKELSELCGDIPAAYSNRRNVIEENYSQALQKINNLIGPYLAEKYEKYEFTYERNEFAMDTSVMSNSYSSMERTIEESMAESLEKGYFKVHYQPLYRAGSREPEAAEAFIRWYHPEHGILSPAFFLPLFEKNGFAAETDIFVINQVCSDMRKWRDKGLKNISVSVNFSASVLSRDDIADIIRKALTDNNLEPECLCIEVSEALLMSISPGMKKLSEIKAMGVNLAIDNFGAGYSSLSILRLLPFDMLKLDKGIIDRCTENSIINIIGSLAGMANHLGMMTVAECVETPEQKEILERNNIDFLQGYLYGKPETEEKFEMFIKQ